MKNYLKIVYLLLVIFVIGTSTSVAQNGTTDFKQTKRPVKIAINNITSETAYVAIRYKNTSGNWTTKYWFKYRGYQKDEDNNAYCVETYNRYFYIYARSVTDHRGKYYEWRGTGTYSYVDGKRVGFAEHYISRSKISSFTGQKFYVNLR